MVLPCLSLPWRNLLTADWAADSAENAQTEPCATVGLTHVYQNKPPHSHQNPPAPLPLWVALRMWVEFFLIFFWNLVTVIISFGFKMKKVIVPQVSRKDFTWQNDSALAVTLNALNSGQRTYSGFGGVSLSDGCLVAGSHPTLLFAGGCGVLRSLLTEEQVHRQFQSHQVNQNSSAAAEQEICECWSPAHHAQRRGPLSTTSFIPTERAAVWRHTFWRPKQGVEGAAAAFHWLQQLVKPNGQCLIDKQDIIMYYHTVCFIIFCTDFNEIHCFSHLFIFYSYRFIFFLSL